MVKLAAVLLLAVAVTAQTSGDVIDLTKDLVSIESTTGNEKPMADFLFAWLSRRNYTIERQIIEEGRRENIFAYKGQQRNTRLLFNSHLDTVPPYIPLKEDDSFLAGRGSTDAKSSIAAQLLAVEALWNSGQIKDGDVSFLFVVGEEDDHIGMIRSSDLGLTPKYLVVGEPTESKLAVGHKGALKFHLQSFGKAAHSGYPELGQSAIIPLLEVLLDLERTPLPYDPLLGPSTLNIGVINGGVADNVVPDFAEAGITIRVSTSVDEIRTIVRAVVRDRVIMTEIAANDPVYCGTVPGFETAVMAYNTDIPFFSGSPIPYLIGPGSILVAHSEDEAISKLELIDHVDLYERLVVTILNQ